MLDGFCTPGKASFIIGGQWGSEGKGAAAAFVAEHLKTRNEQFDIITTNAGAQAGHTSTVNGKTKWYSTCPRRHCTDARPDRRGGAAAVIPERGVDHRCRGADAGVG